MKKLRILVVDRPTKEREDLIKDIYHRYCPSQCDMFILIAKRKDKTFIHGAFYVIQSWRDLAEALGIYIDFDIDFSPTVFNVEGMDEETFYTKIREKFDLTVAKLTEVEKLAA